MYLSHFNLKRNPFKTDPDFLWLGKRHKEALETLRYGIRNNDGYVVITGDIGTGKTTLASALVNDLGDEAVVARIPYPEGDILDFFKLISTAYGMSADFQSKDSFLVQFESFLRRSFSAGEKVVLIIDEAERMSHGHLEELLHLTHIEENGTRLLNIVFVGQNEFNAILLEQSDSALRHGVAVNYNLGALTQEETGQYILHRLRVAQCEREIFTSEAIRDIFLYSEGNPRVINLVCDLALLITYSQSGERVLPETVKLCAERLRLPNEKPESASTGTDRSSGMEGNVENEIGEAIREEVNAERVRKNVRKPAWVRGVYAIAFGYLVLLSGLIFLHRQGQVQQKQHSAYEESKKEEIRKSGMIQSEMESLTVEGFPGAGFLDIKELLLSPGAVEGSEPSAQQDRSGRLEEIGRSKDASAQTLKPESRETVGSRASVGPARQTFTDPPREKRSPNEKAKDLEDKGKFASEDRSGGLSQSPGLTTERSAQETSSKDEEEVDSGRVIDWLLEKRGDKDKK